MQKLARWRLVEVAVVGLAVLAVSAAVAQQPGRGEVVKFARFRVGETTAHGVVEGDRIRQIEGNIFGEWSRTDKTYALNEVKLLVPTRPTKVLALALNYKSHAGDKPVPPHPEVFFKPPTCLIPTGGNIVIPKGTESVHYEAEMVIVIGKRAKNVPVAKALQFVLGVTCGNDVSARDWQTNDLQWWRAKGTDTFGPCGPFIVSGLDYDNLQLQLRLNGETKQKQSTRDMVHNVATTVSFISQHVTLYPGDLIYTGTPGATGAIKPGDVVEVHLEGVGVLKNGVVAAR